jgi:hypothetical protein
MALALEIKAIIHGIEATKENIDIPLMEFIKDL